jgi:hypothetical protein
LLMRSGRVGLIRIWMRFSGPAPLEVDPVSGTGG